jgi:ArsR family transcriptional regulator
MAVLGAARRSFGLTGRAYFDICRNMRVQAGDRREAGTGRLPPAGSRAGEAHVEAFKALAHRARLAIFFLLVKARREVAAGDIAAELEIPAPTLSHHLEVLRRAGLVTRRREERFVYYSPRPEMVSALVRLLTACC